MIKWILGMINAVHMVTDLQMNDIPKKNCYANLSPFCGLDLTDAFSLICNAAQSCNHFISMLEEFSRVSLMGMSCRHMNLFTFTHRVVTSYIWMLHLDCGCSRFAWPIFSLQAACCARGHMFRSITNC